ncbi:hypothetical protein [Flavobacterium sp.]|uniref:hypothetical protein n=1 Tax=Flavobacterium sp. TaxID=239 RepID=UPI0012212FBD|nr:hypothetical protein [Flavobacterium sp.]RZJ70528.1 MAG: hypothetical protein EOO49_13805 [Flavobacterium sp.]
MSDPKGKSLRKSFPASFFISEFLGLSGRVFGSSRKAFLLLLRPGKSSPAEGDEQQHSAAKLPQTQNERSSFLSGFENEIISENTESK